MRLVRPACYDEYMPTNSLKAFLQALRSNPDPRTDLTARIDAALRSPSAEEVLEAVNEVLHEDDRIEIIIPAPSGLHKQTPLLRDYILDQKRLLDEEAGRTPPESE